MLARNIIVTNTNERVVLILPKIKWWLGIAAQLEIVKVRLGILSEVRFQSFWDNIVQHDPFDRDVKKLPERFLRLQVEHVTKACFDLHPSLFVHVDPELLGLVLICPNERRLAA